MQSALVVDVTAFRISVEILNPIGASSFTPSCSEFEVRSLVYFICRVYPRDRRVVLRRSFTSLHFTKVTIISNFLERSWYRVVESATWSRTISSSVVHGCSLRCSEELINGQYPTSVKYSLHLSLLFKHPSNKHVFRIPQIFKLKYPIIVKKVVVYMDLIKKCCIGFILPVSHR